VHGSTACTGAPAGARRRLGHGRAHARGQFPVRARGRRAARQGGGRKMKPKIALCLPGGGVTGAMYQIGALAALEDVVQGFQANDLGLYVGTSSGASVAAALAGGIPVQRMYRALLDPADVFFPLERRDLLRMDLGEWARALGTLFGAVRHGGESVLRRKPAPSPQALWEQL